MMATLDRRAPRTYPLVSVIESEFAEMPGMRLTFGQVRRLWNLSTEDCARVLADLVAAGRLARDEEGRYFRKG
jgi:hypothetical protein